MSKMRSISATIFGSSRYSGLFHSTGCRVGASRLPSLVVIWRVSEKGARTPPFIAVWKGPSVRERVQGLLEAIGVRALGLGEGLEPVCDLVELLPARGFRHAGIHVGVLVRLAGHRGLEGLSRSSDRQGVRGIAVWCEV